MSVVVGLKGNNRHGHHVGAICLHTHLQVVEGKLGD